MHLPIRYDGTETDSHVKKELQSFTFYDFYFMAANNITNFDI